MAPVTVILPPALVALFPGCAQQASVVAATVQEAIAALDGRWPGMRDRLCENIPSLRRHIRIFVDGTQATLATPLQEGAEIFIITAISGG